MIVLGKCPHCGNKADMKYGTLCGTGVNLNGWQVMCERCGTAGPAIEGPNKEAQRSAARAWNKMSQMCGGC